MDYIRDLRMDSLRYPIMATSFLALLLAIAGGLNRIGYSLLWVPTTATLDHGGLMVSSFLGTVIAMERAVAIPIPGSLIVPLMTVIGSVLLLFGYPAIGLFFVVASSLGLLGLFVYIHTIQSELHNLVLIAGGFCWLVGNVLWWYNVPVYSLVSWWMGFLVFVVAAERLELNRLAQFSRVQEMLFISGVLLALIGMSVNPLGFSGVRLVGVGFIVLALWLIRNDMVRKMLFMGGERGYTGWCLFTGYFWLGFGGLLLVIYPSAHSGFLYDAYLHSIFLGFVFTMIFGHAFIIMPGVLDLDLTYHNGFYVPLILLEGTLVLRITGDLLFNNPLRQWGGLGNGFSIVLFLLMLGETQIRRNKN
jgi:hypothetical protein